MHAFSTKKQGKNHENALLTHAKRKAKTTKTHTKVQQNVVRNA